jgi:hypothetical protein
MPVTMEPCESGHVLRFVFTDPWTIAEMLALYPASDAYHSQAPHRVHTLCIYNARQIPLGVLQLRHGAPSLVHPNSGRMVIVSSWAALRAIVGVIYKISHYEQGRFFDTEEEALAFLRQIIASEAGAGQRIDN